MKRLSILAKALIAGSIVAATMAPASATPILGTAHLSFDPVHLSFEQIDWSLPFNPGFNPATTYGSFTTTGAGNTGSFAGPAFSGVSGGQIRDISTNPAGGNFFPVNVPSLIQNFLSFAAQPGWQFDGMLLSPGTSSFLPILLTEVGGNVLASMAVSGFVCDAGGNAFCDPGEDRTRFDAVFTAQYNNTSTAAMQAILIGGGTLSNESWTGTVTASAIPEPASIALIGLALAGLCVMRSRKA
ncbi:MAG TPA: PEP-CTERM sorting domain-containing protein [Telluria sp.]|nr:PEP-CTERM sorting domain-containing protein [Telluria sp.]